MSFMIRDAPARSPRGPLAQRHENPLLLRMMLICDVWICFYRDSAAGWTELSVLIALIRELLRYLLSGSVLL